MFSKKKPITVSIQEPCSEQWHKMKTSDNGRFCLSCQKNVIDFSVMSNEQIIQYLSTHKDVCGRFKEDQLNVPLQVRQIERKSIFTKLFISSIFSFFYFNNLKSQEVNEIKTEIVANEEKKDSLKLNPKITETKNISVNSSEVQGVYQEDENSGLNVVGGRAELHLPKENSFKEKLKRFFNRNKKPQLPK